MIAKGTVPFIKSIERMPAPFLGKKPCRQHVYGFTYMYLDFYEYHYHTVPHSSTGCVCAIKRLSFCLSLLQSKYLTTQNFCVELTCVRDVWLLELKPGSQ